MKIVSSIQKIERKYNTGDEPILVDCSDSVQRLCKYSRVPDTSANKLIAELIGAKMLEKWNLDAPDYCFVDIKKEHIPENMPFLWFDCKCFGTSIINNTIDVSLNNLSLIKHSQSNMIKLLRIALYDIWIANEDRSNNNANLIYDYIADKIIPIDNGGIFNTVNMNSRLYLIDECDSILNSELFARQINEQVINIAIEQKNYFDKCLILCQEEQTKIFNIIPKCWNANPILIKNKIEELFSQDWTTMVWQHFLSILKQ